MKNLLIVESPTKANTISKYLPNDFNVIATKGHLEDLPKSKLGINIDKDFEPEYVLLKDRSQILKDLKKAVSQASNIYIATDPDREGESIGWHVLNLLKIKDSDSVQRVTFHEVTKEAVLNAIKNSGSLNMDLVDSQQARRILDRIVGYKLSPLLWTKIRYGLSAGRVQSVALRFIVERERERDAFVSEEYWTINPIFDINKTSIEFLLSKVNKKNVKVINKDQSDFIINEIKNGKHSIFDVKTYKMVKRPSPPYTTSVLQQDASNKLGFSSKKTMMLAQRLYEGVKIGNESIGLITYMRTDSITLSTDAISKIRQYISSNLDKKYLPDAPNIYKTKSKLAQEAHEAIRPSYINRDPESIKKYLDPSLYKLYKLIWERSVASQVSNAVYNVIKISVETKYDKNRYLSTSTISTVEFDGFQKLLNKKGKENNINVNIASKSDINKIILKDVLGEQHFTEPPPRYNDASLVKEMEKSGIGRPSTYASIISTLISRGYIIREKKYFYPTDVGIVVNDFLVQYFANIVDTKFTSGMEDQLDLIANGKMSWKKMVKDFYTPFVSNIEEKENIISKEDVTNLGESDENCPECGKKMIVKLGKYGNFLSCSDYPQCKGIKSLETDQDKNEIIDEKCPECGSDLTIKTGRFGKFIACSNYPKCKYTRSVNEQNKKELDKKCPECKKGNIVELKNKRGKIFYGCTEYPKCKFTASSLEKIED